MSTAEVFSACTAGKQIGLQISATRWHSCMACRIQQCLQGVEMGDVCLCKHDNNMHKMFIFLNDLYQFPVVLCCIFFSLSLFKDIFSAVPLSKLGLFQRDVFEVLCLCPVERVQEISGNFFFLLTWTAMNEKCFLQFSILSAAQNFLFTISSVNFALLHFYLLIYFVVQWTSHQISKVSFPPRGHFPVMLSKFG